MKQHIQEGRYHLNKNVGPVDFRNCEHVNVKKCSAK